MTNAIPLPGGWSLMPPLMPPPSMPVGQLQGIPALPTLPGLDPTLLSALAPALGAAVPQLAPFLPFIGIGVSALGVLVNHLFDTQTQMAADPANQALQALEASLKTRIQGLFAPHMQAAAGGG